VPDIALSFADASKSFGSLKAVDSVSFSVERGGFFGLLGPNGAGKTTLINLLCGLNKLSSGKIDVMGFDVSSDPLEARARLGVVPQELVYDPYFNVTKCLEIQSNYYGLSDNKKWIGDLLERLELGEKSKANTRSLSGGMKRRLMIAQALVHKPPIIVLDEPTAGVDINLRQSLWEFIRELNEDGHTILLTTHYLEEAEELCSDIVMMNEGRLIAYEKKSDLLERFRSIILTVKIGGGECPSAWSGRIVNCKPTAGASLCTLSLDSYGQIEDFLREVRETGASIDMMEVDHPDLEDIFIDLVQERRPEEKSVPGEVSPVPAIPQQGAAR